MLSLQNLFKEFGAKTVLKEVNLTIYDGEKIGIIGNNGQGKSTLLDIIVGKQKADSGQVVFDGNLAFLEQNAKVNEQEIFSNLQNPTYASNFYRYLAEFEFLKDFEFDSKRIAGLSSGEHIKICLANVLAKEPNLLILDEPTTHLDIKGKDKLVSIINDFYGTVLLVSHEKDFLNQTVDKILELNNGEITEYIGNYDDYVEQKENHKLHIKREYEKHQKKLKDIDRQIEVYQKALRISDMKRRAGAQRTCNTTTQDERAKSLSKFASNRMTKLQQERDKKVQRPEKEHEIFYNLNAENLKTKFPIMVENLTKTIGNMVLFEDVTFNVLNGDKIALIGDNGVGKTTLIKILLDKIDYQGIVKIAPSVKIAVMEQDFYDLDLDTTINELSNAQDKDYRTKFITNLCSMNIDKSRFDTKLKYLSSGEKMRIKLTEIILSDTNLIILDEPTNHLDIMNKNYLQQVLQGFKGTLIIISHDRDFLANTTNKILEIKNHKITLKDKI